MRKHLCDKNANNDSWIPVETSEYFSGDSQFSMQLIIREWQGKDQFQIDIDYRCDDFDDCEVHAIPSAMMTLFKQMENDPSIKVSCLSLISEADQKILATYNSTTMDLRIVNVIDAITEQAMAFKEQTALRYDDFTMTYGTMIKKAMAFSALLAKLGVEKGSCVALIASHSPELIISILAILGAGGAFIPFDPRHPKQRIAYVLQNANAMLLITDSLDKIPEGYTGQVLNLTEPSIFSISVNSFPVSPKREDIAYVIYTSGTTGQPKGVAITHGNLANYIEWAVKEYVKSANDVFAFYSSIAADLTITSLFVPLLSGCITDIYAADKPDSVIKVLKDNRCTILKLTPTHLMLLAESSHGNTSLQRLIVGGENLLVSVVRRVDKAFGRNLDVYNEYGPTEATVGCMIHHYNRVADVESSVPIGRPIINTKIYIMNSMLEPVPIGITGELFIGGAGVALGYFNNPEMTAAKFIIWRGELLYSTGDLARFIRSDCIEYLGRIDNQIKLHGHRIETEEIKAVLLNVDGVEKAEVVLWKPPKGNKRLIAYIVGVTSEEVLKEHLKHILPEYMIPTLYVWLEEIPLLTNGKTDIRSLPAPMLTSRDKTSTGVLSETEAILIREVDSLLELNGEVDITDDFIKLGGDSIKAILLSSNIKRFGYDLLVKDIITHTILTDMSACMRQEVFLTKLQNETYGEIELMPPIRWFNKNIKVNKNKYHHRIQIRPTQFLALEILNLAVTELIRHHAILRVNYNNDNKLLFYNENHESIPPSVFFYDLSELTQDSKEIIEFECEKIENNHRINRDLLFALCYFKFSDSSTLVITAHHLLVDGVSWHIIINDLERLLKLNRDKINGALGKPSASYKTWAEIENKKWRDYVDEIPYWVNIERILTEKASNKRTIIKDNAVLHKQKLLTRIIADVHKPYNTTNHDIVTTALSLTLARINETNDVLLQMEGHGRDMQSNEIDITRTVGWMTSMYPVYINIKEKSISELIIEVKRTLQTVPSNGIHYGTLATHSDLLGNIPVDNLYRINYLGEIGTSNDSNRLLIIESFSQELDNREITDCLIDINIAMICDELDLYMRSSYYTHEELKNFADIYNESLQKIITHCLGEQKRHYLPTDFSHVQITDEELKVLLEADDKSSLSPFTGDCNV